LGTTRFAPAGFREGRRNGPGRIHLSWIFLLVRSASHKSSLTLPFDTTLENSHAPDSAAEPRPCCEIDCYRRRFLLGHLKFPSSSSRPNSSSSSRASSFFWGGTSPFSNDNSVSVWSHGEKCFASSSRMPPRSQSANQISASPFPAPLPLRQNGFSPKASRAVDRDAA
jgi:hypothetical protein